MAMKLVVTQQIDDALTPGTEITDEAAMADVLARHPNRVVKVMTPDPDPAAPVTEPEQAKPSRSGKSAASDS